MEGGWASKAILWSDERAPRGTETLNRVISPSLPFVVFSLHTETKLSFSHLHRQYKSIYIQKYRNVYKHVHLPSHF